MVKNITTIRQNYEGELNRFEIQILKRQLFQLMFLEHNPSNSFDSISYSDLEYLDKYTGLQGAYADYINAGVYEYGLSFKEWIKLPNSEADWIIEYCLKKNRAKSEVEKKAMDGIEQTLNNIQDNGNKKNNHYMGGY